MAPKASTQRKAAQDSPKTAAALAWALKTMAPSLSSKAAFEAKTLQWLTPSHTEQAGFVKTPQTQSLSTSARLFAQQVETHVLAQNAKLFDKAVETLKHSQQLQNQAVNTLKKLQTALNAQESTQAQKLWNHWHEVLQDLAEDIHTIYSPNNAKLKKLGLAAVQIPIEMACKQLPSSEEVQQMSGFWLQQSEQLAFQVQHLEQKLSYCRVALENHAASNTPY